MVTLEQRKQRFEREGSALGRHSVRERLRLHGFVAPKRKQAWLTVLLYVQLLLGCDTHVPALPQCTINSAVQLHPNLSGVER